MEDMKERQVPDYLDEILFYLQDGLEMMLLTKQSAAIPESESTTPLQSLCEYFNRLSRREVIGREYAFIGKTQYNRQSFIYFCVETFFQEDTIDTNIHQDINGLDLHELLRQLCPDFPLKIVEQMASCMVMHEQPHVIDDEDDEELELTACLQLSCNLPELLDAFYIYFYYQEFFQLLQEQIKTSSSSFCAQIPMDELFQEATARLQPGQIIPSFIIRRALTSNGKDDGISIPEVMLRLLKDVDLANTLKERKQKDLPTITSGINSKSKQDEDVKALFAQYYDRLTADTEGVKAPHEKQKRSKKPSSR